MKLRLALVGLILVGCGGNAAPPKAPVVARELPAEWARLRKLGPEGLAQVIAAYNAAAPEDKAPLSAEMDAVAGQLDARYTRLYWYTDLDEAKAASRASGKPILSLRLLGRLDEEYSCANSRFFRTTLYPNADVQAMLREKFVLHWSTERPAPVMTIDFGDGRVAKRTVTGNSIHYVLDSDAAVVDGIPGLLGPKAFVTVASNAAALAKKTAGMSDRNKGIARAIWHQEELARLRKAWPEDERRAGMQPTWYPLDGALMMPTQVAASGGNRNAAFAAPIAPSKAAVEFPVVRNMVTKPNLAEAATLVPWAKVAPTHAAECVLDDHAKEAMRSKHGEGDFDVVEAAFEKSMAEDTVRNEYMYHAQIHGYLSAIEAGSFESLNAKVYDEIFATPKSDPWLGLVPPNAYTGLESDGIWITMKPRMIQ